MSTENPKHNDPKIQALLRHSDIRVTMDHYAHLTPDNATNAATLLEGSASRSGHVT